MPDLVDDIPQPFSVRQRGQRWDVVVLPLLARAKPTLVAESTSESVAETIAEECNAAVAAYAKAVMDRKKRWEATPKPKAVREPKEVGAVRGAEAKANQDTGATAPDAKKAKAAEVKAKPAAQAKEPSEREMLLRRILALPAVKRAIKDGELSLQTLKKDSYARLLRRQELLGNVGIRNRRADATMVIPAPSNATI